MLSRKLECKGLMIEFCFLNYWLLATDVYNRSGPEIDMIRLIRWLKTSITTKQEEKDDPVNLVDPV